jgi:site-specific DNA recombinase
MESVDEMPLRAANVGRVSDPKDKKKSDKSRQARSVSEQHDDNRAEITAHGWLEAGSYEDEESASRFARKDRPDWLRLLADIEADLFDVVVFWESSRGSRKLGEWIDFLDLCREHKTLIHITTHRHTYDVANRRDRKALVEDGVDNEDESEKTSERVRRHLKANKLAGMPHGIVNYGYERDHDPRTGALLGQHPHPEHAAICAEIIRRVAAAEPVSVICDDLEKRQVPPPNSDKWYRRTITRIATSPAMIGKIKVDGELIDAQWEPVSDDPKFEETFWAAQHVLSAPERKVTRPGRARHLLSYIMACGECGSPVYADLPRHRMKTAKYTCSDMHGHHASAPMADADELVTLAVLRRLAEPDLYKHLVSGSDERVVQARAEAARLRAELDEWAAADISAHAYGIREGKLLPLIEAAEKRAAELTVPLALRELLAPGADIAARWEAMTVAARRDVIRLLFPGLRLIPGRGPARDRIVNRRADELSELADLPGA